MSCLDFVSSFEDVILIYTFFVQFAGAAKSWDGGVEGPMLPSSMINQKHVLFISYTCHCFLTNIIHISFSNCVFVIQMCFHFNKMSFKKGKLRAKSKKTCFRIEWIGDSFCWKGLIELCCHHLSSFYNHLRRCQSAFLSRLNRIPKPPSIPLYAS